MLLTVEVFARFANPHGASSPPHPASGHLFPEGEGKWLRLRRAVIFSKTLCCLTVAALLFNSSSHAEAGELLIGTAETSITPDRPVALAGQRHTRIAREIESPVTATALAIEAREGEQILDQAIMISCDLVAIRDGIQDGVREELRRRLPSFDSNKLFIAATHTHTAPVTGANIYVISDPDVIPPAEYVEFLQTRLVDTAVRAWGGAVDWRRGLGTRPRPRRSQSKSRLPRQNGQDVWRHSR